MNRSMLRRTGIALGLCLASATAHAELEVSINISGDLDEIIAVLQQLQQAGLGDSGSEHESLKLHVESTATQDDLAAAPAPMPEEAPEAVAAPEPEAPAPAVLPEPPVGFSNLSVEPGVVRNNEIMRVSLELRDTEQVVDTIAATMADAEREFTFDLFDNGSHGDAAAGDNVWAVDVKVPEAASVGNYALHVRAYDADGMLITSPDAGGVERAIEAESRLSVAP